ncbi:hypothetical protein [uncultured Megamonas sp.]|uniref:hypothetical protein n=1 Tax=uncultured Megamonas sp. TaxID=286140 RepID=UPI00259B30FD|nr:hypothetical protein [uncultured Megamonas sp.]
MNNEVIFESNLNSITKRLKKFIDNGTRVLISWDDIYVPDPSVVVVFDRLYPHFALGHNVHNGQKVTVLYNALIAHQLDMFISDDSDFILDQDGSIKKSKVIVTI